MNLYEPLAIDVEKISIVKKEKYLEYTLYLPNDKCIAWGVPLTEESFLTAEYFYRAKLAVEKRENQQDK